MRHLLLVRHGESLWNAEGRIQGQSCAGLSLRGHEQARAFATAYGPGLLLRLETDAGAVRVVSSDLQRAAETAAPVSSWLGVAVAHDPRLRERASVAGRAGPTRSWQHRSPTGTGAGPPAPT